ncbi:Detected protein of confused Function [Hibiscus syriacus]|uniref:Detected protein of confused Function n=1 Tax=Hibiscus syriacus TaxID=106335 RepID=A0A6A2XF09_HIBSY|nr:Detected protein of confused Function [Hibiscus syriacus]
MHAAKLGHTDAVKALLQAGAPWNALSPSNQSAGDFAMYAGYQEAFEVLLNAGIQAELILETVARKTKKHAVMMAWEKSLMEAHAKAVCTGGGNILNVGFGMGLVDTTIQQYGPATHTIVEAYPEVYERMLQIGWGKKDNMKIIFGRWKDVLSQLDSYDGIFFDTYGEYYEDLREFHQHLRKLLKPGGI